MVISQCEYDISESKAKPRRVLITIWTKLPRLPYMAKILRGITFAVGIEKDRSRENVLSIMNAMAS